MKRRNSLSHHGYKTFLAGIEATHQGSTKGKKYLEDKRLTSLEKKLLTCFLKVRENNFSFINDLSIDTSFETIPFLDGVRHLILGFVYVYKAESLLAEDHLEKASVLLQEETNEEHIQRMLFKAYSNLFYAYVNQKKFKKMSHQFKKVASLINLSDEDRISFQLMEVCLCSMTGEYSRVEDLFIVLDKQIPQMNDIQVISLLIEKFDFFVKLDFHDKARKVLQEMKKHRTFRLSACFQYMDKLLKFVEGQERIYIYDKDFIEHDDLYLMINVICKLDEAKLDEASDFWTKLALRSPDVYHSNFQYKGDKCLFSVALEKSLTRKEMKPVKLQKKYSDSEMKLIMALLEAPGRQIIKEEIFSMLYGKELSSKDDLLTLATFIYRINKKSEILIKSRKGTYFIALKDQEAA